MVFKHKFNLEKGVSLIEIVAVIFIISVFFTILIVGFPEIQKRFALSRTTYQIAQDLRKTQDMALSGLTMDDINGNEIAVKGYGIYFDKDDLPTKYIIYADVATVVNPDGSHNFDVSVIGDVPLCSEYDAGLGGDTGDCIYEAVDVTAQNANLYISGVSTDGGNISYTSINFRPPDPIVDISNAGSYKKVGITVGIQNETASRTVYANTSGLIYVQ